MIKLTKKLIHYLEMLPYIIYGGFLILAAPASVITSAYIEWQFSVVFFSQTPIFFITLAVIAFETGKLCLALMVGLHKSKHYNLKHPTFYKRFYGVLFSFSVIATLLYTLNSLHNPHYDDVLTQKVELINQGYEKKLQEVEKRYDKDVAQAQTACKVEKENIHQIHQIDIDYWKGRMKEEEKYRDRKGNFRGPRYETFKNNHDEAIKERNEAVRAVNCNTTSMAITRRAEIEQLTQNKKAALIAAETDLQTSYASANEFLATPLLMLTKAMGDDDDYSYTLYVLLVIIMSVLFTIALESTIWVSSHLLASNHGRKFGNTLSHNELQGIVKENLEMQQQIDEMEWRALKKQLINGKNHASDTLKKIRNNII